MGARLMRFIFTVTPGRSGQASLTELANRCGLGVRAAFEEPQVRPVLPGPLGDLERRFRRRFVETHEILGRGEVLRAFSAGDAVALRRMAAARLAWIRKFAAGNEIFFDISKYFIRGLHRPLIELAGPSPIVFLVRDPILNMRSFVNRRKDFFLDNNPPSDRVNCLPMDGTLSPEDLYFWSWAEGYLRGIRLIDEMGLAPPRVIWTQDLTDAGVMTDHFAALGIPFDRVEPIAAINTNEQQGHGKTAVSRDDVTRFEAWLGRVPAALWNQLTFMRGYDPRRQHGIQG